MKIIKRMLQMFKPFYLNGIVICILILTSSLISVGMPFLYKLIIDDGILKNDFQNLIKWVLAIVALIIVQELLYIIQIAKTLTMRKNMFTDLRKNLYQHLMGMSQSFYAKTHTGRLLSRITSDVDAMQNLMLEKFAYLLQNILVSILVIIIISYINWRMVLAAIIFVPILFGMYHYFSKKISLLNKSLQQKQGSLMETLKDDFSLVKILQSFSVTDNRLENAILKINDTEDAKKVLSFQYTKSASSTVVISIIGIIIIWGYGGYEVMQGRMSIGTLVAISFYLNYIRNLFFSTYYTVMGFNSSLPAAESVFEIFDTVSNIIDSPSAIEVSKLEGSIEFKNVTFGYDEKNPVLNKINFAIQQNEFVAISGVSGVGKTTLVNLIPRFYDPDSGVIEINNINIKNIKLECLRKNIAVVPQEDYIFNISIRENIILGRKGITEEQFERSVSLAGVDSFAVNLDKGYETNMGENGLLLSGGQRKRILIARAILENPYILIFDEATANLDIENEMLILNSIKQLSKDKIVIFISHKQSHLEFADRIILIENGSLTIK